MIFVSIRQNAIDAQKFEIFFTESFNFLSRVEFAAGDTPATILSIYRLTYFIFAHLQQAWVFLRVLLLRCSILLCLYTHSFNRLSRWNMLVNWLFGLSRFRSSCCRNIACIIAFSELRYGRRRRDQHDILRQCVHAQLWVNLTRYAALKALEDYLSRWRCGNAILPSGWAELLASICLLTFWCVTSSSTAASVLCRCLCL